MELVALLAQAYDRNRLSAVHPQSARHQPTVRG
jgi:hypothetical protein